MSLITSIKAFLQGVKAMFSTTDIKKIVGGEAAITSTMITRIDIWRKMYDGKAAWISDKDGICSLGLESSIAREFADVCLNEMESSTGNDKLDVLYKAAIRDLNENFQEGIALGAFCIKPLGVSAVEYVAQGDFVPIAYDSRGRLMDVIFIELRRKGDSDHYRRLERHTVSDAGLTITNKAYKSQSESDIGREIPLDTFDDWAKLKPEIFYPDWNKPDFGYYKNPLKNKIDRSFNGVSIFESAIELIKKADKQFGRLEWEYESAERAIIADPEAIPQANDEGYRLRPKERLLRALGMKGNGDAEAPYVAFSPELRGDGYIGGLEEFKRNIESNVGLSFGDLSREATIEKTATEIKSAKKTKYNRVIAIEDNLKDCLSDLVDAMAFVNGLVNTGYEYKCEFGDSILTDDESNKASDKADVAAGLMNPWEYRMKWYGEDEATAKANVPQSAGVMPDTFGGAIKQP